MSITYKYEIISVDQQARCMEVVYTADGHQTMHISARIPFEGEQLEDVIHAFSPVPLWEEQSKTVVAPTVGASGTITPPVFVPPVASADVFTEVSGIIPQEVL